MIKVFLIFLVSVVTLSANPYILFHDDLIDQRAQDKIFEIGSEVKSKLNANIYVHVRENNGINKNLSFDERQKLMREYEKFLVKDLKGTYAVLVIVLDQRHVTVLMSEDIKDVIDKEDVRSGYVVPLLASKDKNTLFAKTSAASLNGYAQIADSLASNKNIKLQSSIGSEGKTASTIWRVFMYTLVVIGIGIYTFVVLRERKFKKEGK